MQIYSLPVEEEWLYTSVSYLLFKMAFHLFITISKLQHSLNYFPQCPESMVGSSLPCYRPPAPPPSHRALGQSSPLQSARNDQLHPLKGLVCFASNHFHCHPHTSPGKATYNCLLPRLLYTFIPFLFVHLHIFDSQ